MCVGRLCCVFAKDYYHFSCWRGRNTLASSIGFSDKVAIISDHSYYLIVSLVASGLWRRKNEFTLARSLETGVIEKVGIKYKSVIVISFFNDSMTLEYLFQLK